MVVTLNSFLTDTQEEIGYVKRFCEERGCEFAISEVWEKGGEGGVALAEKVLKTLAEKESHFHVLYEDSLSLTEKIEAVAKEIYGADGVVYSPAAKKQLAKLTELDFPGFLCAWPRPSIPCRTTLPFWEDRSISRSASGKLMCPRARALWVVLTGAVMTMPGLPKTPAAFRIDVDEDGRITGLF